jgi:hypothetical protein
VMMTRSNYFIIPPKQPPQTHPEEYLSCCTWLQ